VSSPIAIATMRVRGDSRRISWTSNGLAPWGSIAATCGCVRSMIGTASLTVATLPATTKGGRDKPLASASRYKRTGAMMTSESAAGA